LEFTCRICGKVVLADEVRMIPVMAYRIAENLRTEFSAYCLLESPIVDFLKKAGYAVEAPKTITGLSGIQHSFDVYARKEGSEAMFDILSGPEEVSLQAAIGFLAKVIDAKPPRTILIAMPKLSKEAQKLSALYGFEIVEGEKGEEIVEKLQTSLKVTTSTSGQADKVAARSSQTLPAPSPLRSSNHLSQSRKKPMSPGHLKAVREIFDEKSSSS